MAEKTEKEKKPAKKTTTRAKAPAKAASTRAGARAKAPAKAPAKAAVAARPGGKRTVARKRAAPAAPTAPGEKEQFTWRRFRRKTKVGGVVSAEMAKTIVGEGGRVREHPPYKKRSPP